MKFSPINETVASDEILIASWSKIRFDIFKNANQHRPYFMTLERHEIFNNQQNCLVTRCQAPHGLRAKDCERH